VLLAKLVGPEKPKEASVLVVELMVGLARWNPRFMESLKKVGFKRRWLVMTLVSGWDVFSPY